MPLKKQVLLVENGVTLLKVTDTDQGGSQTKRYMVESSRIPGQAHSFHTRLEALEQYETELARIA